MMVSENRIGEVIKVSTALLTLIPLTMRLCFILATLDDILSRYTWDSKCPTPNAEKRKVS